MATRRQVMGYGPGCGTKFQEWIQHGYSCKEITVTCGSTSPHGTPWLCDKCAALPENRNRDWRREAEEAGERWDEDY